MFTQIVAGWCHQISRKPKPMHSGFKVQPNSCSDGRMFELHRAVFDTTRLFAHQSAHCVHFLCGHKKSDLLQDEYDLWHHRRFGSRSRSNIQKTHEETRGLADFTSDTPFFTYFSWGRRFFCNNYLRQEGCVFSSPGVFSRYPNKYVDLTDLNMIYLIRDETKMN